MLQDEENELEEKSETSDLINEESENSEKELKVEYSISAPSLIATGVSGALATIALGAFLWFRFTKN
jgi:hypothetical protein